MCEAQAIPRAGRAPLVIELVVQVQRFLTASDSRPVVTEDGVAPANRIESDGLTVSMVGDSVEVEGLLSVLKRLVVVTAPFRYEAKIEIGVRLRDMVAEFAEQVEGASKMRVSVIVIKVYVRGPDAPMRVRLSLRVTDLPGGL